MSKRVRNLIIALAALAVVGTGVAVLLLLPSDGTTPATDDTTEATEPTQAPDIVIVDKRYNKQGGTVADPVLSMEIHNQTGGFLVSTGDDGTMAVDTYRDLPADSTTIDTLCTNAAYLTALSTPDVNEDDAAYGFTDPTAGVIVTYHDGSEVTITFGAKSKGSDGYYCRVSGNETLYIVESAIAEGYMTNDLALVGKTLITPPSPDEGDEEGSAALFKLWLTGSLREHPIEVVTDETASFPSLTYTSTMYMKAPYLRSLDSDLFSSMSGVMLYLQASGVEAVHPTAEQLATYGLDDPYSVAAFTLSVVATASGEEGGTVATHYNDREHMVMLGGTNEDGQYYALVDGLDIVYLLDPSSVPWAETTYVDLVSKLIFLKDVTTVNTLTITDEGKTTDFTLKHYPDKEKRDEQLVITADGKTFDTRDFRTVYASMMSVHRVGLKEDEVDTSVPPATEWTLTFNDGSEPLNVKLYEMTGSRYLMVMQDGEETAVSISDVETFQKQYRSFIAGEEVVSPY